MIGKHQHEISENLKEDDGFSIIAIDRQMEQFGSQISWSSVDETATQVDPIHQAVCTHRTAIGIGGIQRH